MFAWPHYSTQHLSSFNFLFLYFCLYLYFFSSVRELQQDVRELSLAELPEMDPEENSAEFMGILIKVGTHTRHVVRLLLIWDGRMNKHSCILLSFYFRLLPN